MPRVGVSRRADASAGTEAVAAALGAEEAGTVLLLATTAHDPRAILAAAHAAAGPAVVVGGVGSGVITPEREIEDGPAVVAVAFAPGEAAPFAAGQGQITLPVPAPDPAGLVILLADGYSAHPEPIAGALADALPGHPPVVGALCVGPEAVAPAFRFAGTELVTAGAVGLLVGGQAEVGVAQGVKPLGPALTVTRAERNVIAELDGRPAFAAFAERARPLLGDLRRAVQTVLLTVPAGDGLVVRALVAVDPDRGLLAASEPVAEGTTLRFAVRDADAARASLRAVIDDVRARLGARRPRLALYLACAGRGRALFGTPDHDLAFLRAGLGDVPLAGLIGGGELAPVAGRPRLHLFAGVLAVVTA